MTNYTPGLLPVDTTSIEKETLDGLLHQAASTLGREMNVAAPPQRYPDGTQAVFALGDQWVAKLFEPRYRSDYRREKTFLDHLHGKISLPTPQPGGSGEFDGWPYVIMEQLPGRGLKEVWPQMNRSHQKEVCHEVGQAMAQLHQVPTGPLLPPDEGWPGLAETNRQNCPSRQKKLGLAPHWASQIEPYLDRWWGEMKFAPPVPLHTEIMVDHLLVRPMESGWEITGLLDFESSMVGPVEYEFPSVGLFLAQGDRDLLRTFFEGYGVDPGRLTSEFSQLLLSWTLIHRYCHLPWYFKRMPPPPDTSTLDELAELWFGL